MEDFIIYAIIFAAGWIIGYKISTAIHVSVFKSLLTELNVTNSDLIKVAKDLGKDFITPEQEARLDAAAAAAELEGLEKIEIKIEKHGEMLYAFRNDNDQFVGQGTTREDLIDAMAQRLRNVHCTIVEGKEHMSQEA